MQSMAWCMAWKVFDIGSGYIYDIVLDFSHFVTIIASIPDNQILELSYLHG
jgi:hypothetical protein